LTYHQKISVPFEYDVVFTKHVFAPQNDSLAGVLKTDPARLVFFVDDGLLPHWPGLGENIAAWCDARADSIELAAEVQVVPGGEKIKNSIDILDRVGKLAGDLGLDRHSYAVIVGGGAVLDAVGFAVATVHRGLRQVRIPTTVLSQDDSGVGVKNGLNRFGMKNFYGTFAPPAAVINDTEFLKTLELRDWLAGIAEAFKVAIIKDRPFLDFLAENAELLVSRDQEAMEEVVRRTATLHLDHIRSGGDAFEAGSSRPLDFGHWVAHRLEAMTDYELRHGEAVAIGMAVDMHCAVDLGLLTESERDFAISAIRAMGLPLWHEAMLRRDCDGELELMVGLAQFREHLGGELTLAMPNGLGQQVDISDLPRAFIEKAIEALRAAAAGGDR